ncbi:hypothetical protein ND747_20165, partial [Frankia sp. R82]|nr:hypothetical protein [Frankia sp. R82]
SAPPRAAAAPPAVHPLAVHPPAVHPPAVDPPAVADPVAADPAVADPLDNAPPTIEPPTAESPTAAATTTAPPTATAPVPTPSPSRPPVSGTSWSIGQAQPAWSEPADGATHPSAAAAESTEPTGATGPTTSVSVDDARSVDDVRSPVTGPIVAPEPMTGAITEPVSSTADAAAPEITRDRAGSGTAAPQRRAGARHLPAAEPSRPPHAGPVPEPQDEVPVRLSVRDRSRLPLPGSWRIAVTSLFPYSGTTTLAGVMGLTLAGMRAQPVLAVDLWPGEPDLDAEPGPGGNASPPAAPTDEDEPRGDPLTSRVGSTGATTVADVIRHHVGDGSAAELRLLIGGQRSGSARDLDVLPMRRDAGHLAREQAAGSDTSTDLPVVHGSDEPTVTESGLRSTLGMLAHSYPLVLVDAPTDAPLTDVAVQAADLVVLVTLATAADLEATVMRLRAFREAAGDRPAGPAPLVVAAVVAPRRGRPSPRTRAGAARLGRQVDALVRIPYDPRLDPSRHAPVRIPRLRRRTRRAYLRLAAATIENLFILAKAEVGTPKAAGGKPGTPSPDTIDMIAKRAQTDSTSGLPATTEDHGAPLGVSFGDLRSPTAPSRIAGPDRPGGDLPVRKEPR